MNAHAVNISLKPPPRWSGVWSRDAFAILHIELDDLSLDASNSPISRDTDPRCIGKYPGHHRPYLSRWAQIAPRISNVSMISGENWEPRAQPPVWTIVSQGRAFYRENVVWAMETRRFRKETPILGLRHGPPHGMSPRQRLSMCATWGYASWEFVRESLFSKTTSV